MRTFLADDDLYALRPAIQVQHVADLGDPGTRSHLPTVVGVWEVLTGPSAKFDILDELTRTLDIA
jgi:hypothetical protein